MAKVDSQFPPPPRATVKDFVDHIDYAVKLIGIDHIGISSDFDGGGGVDGWNEASETFNVTLELVRRGYTEQQIAKMWSGNLLRVMREVEKVASGLQKKADVKPTLVIGYWNWLLAVKPSGGLSARECIPTQSQLVTSYQSPVW